MTVLYFLPLLFLILLPRQTLYLYFDKIIRISKRDSLLTRGESLLDWLDSFGLNGFGFDLGSALPEENCYKSYGEFIHLAWQEVQRRGGELGPYLRVIKSLLRVDLKREYEQSEALGLIRFQIIAILCLVWAFLYSLRLVINDGLSSFELLAIGAWQLLGLAIGLLWIKLLKRKYFSPISELLVNLLNLHSLRFSGNLTDSRLFFGQESDKKGLVIFRRMEGLINIWQQSGSHDQGPLEEILEDIVALSQLRSEKLKRITPGFFFIWCSLFVLPALFLSTFVTLGTQI